MQKVARTLNVPAEDIDSSKSIHVFGVEKVLLRAKANGYVYRAYYEEDTKIDNSKYMAKTIKD